LDTNYVARTPIRCSKNELTPITPREFQPGGRHGRDAVCHIRYRGLGDDLSSSKHKSETIMKLPRVTIQRLMVMVTAFALILGLLTALQRRRERFLHLSAEYTSASRAVYTGSNDLTMEGYHADLATKYKAAAERPWMPVDADEPLTDGIRAFWIAHAAVNKAYPGLSLDDYVAEVSVFDGWQGREAPKDRTIYAVRYRRRDNRSGMNVIVDDPVEIYPHSGGPPIVPDKPK
jgi:hypothetical protein